MEILVRIQMGYQFKGKIILAGNLNMGRTNPGLVFQKPGKRHRKQFRYLIFVIIPLCIICVTGCSTTLRVQDAHKRIHHEAVMSRKKIQCAAKPDIRIPDAQFLRSFPYSRRRKI